MTMLPTTPAYDSARMSNPDRPLFVQPELFILRGVPGSGKSHVANALADSRYANAVICSADHYFTGADGIYRFDPTRLPEAHYDCFNNVRAAMSRRDDRIVIDNCNVEPAHFELYEELAAQFGYRVYHLVIERRHNGVNSHGVPADRVETLAARLRDSIRL